MTTSRLELIENKTQF